MCVDHIHDDAILQSPVEAMRLPTDPVQQCCGVTPHPKVLILGIAWHMTIYKRPDLLFSDLVRLISLTSGGNKLTSAACT